ncbi:MAG: AMP-binding protein [Ignavibacteria bacterium]|jgi:long-chain acyl-CoA synthetase|nr:AMP-binding protein [Ignavibacteria bacterium]MCU7501462.1 AMP-binding protein [Ignavibacteria bacterium]MCU7516022.1 AMP-binding protein [Ignavibacteria bacterium]
MKKELKLYNVPHIDSIQEMILQSARKYENKLAVEDISNTPISRLNYGELLEKILKFGAALKKMGIKERTHIAVISENRVQWGITYLTAACFNYIIVPIDRNLKTNEVLNIIHESDTEVIVFSDSFSQMLAEKKSMLKKLRTFISMDSASEENGFLFMKDLIEKESPAKLQELPKINSEELFEIIFTSGSLGRAKGVMLSQRNLAANLIDMVSMLFMYPEDRFLSVLPMHHTYECTCGFLCPLYSGSSVHYARSLKTILDDVQKVQATMFLGVPLLFDKIFKKIYKSINEKKLTSVIIKPMILASDILTKVGWKNSKKKIFAEIHGKFGGRIRFFIAGGAAPDPEVAKGLREFGFGFLQGYGLTETSPIVALNQEHSFKDDAAGLILPNIEARICDPDAEGNGEIWVKGPNVMLGYYNNEKATNDTFEDGWFKTGDIGRFDEDGFLHISGRKKNVIISKSGKNVFPEEIEDILNRSPFVSECFVYGEDDLKQTEIIAAQIVVDAEAFIELSESKNVKITSEMMNEVMSQEIEKVNKQLPSFKQIKKFYIREQEFEKTTTQKIKRYLVNSKD